MFRHIVCWVLFERFLFLLFCYLPGLKDSGDIAIMLVISFCSCCLLVLSALWFLLSLVYFILVI